MRKDKPRKAKLTELSKKRSVQNDANNNSTKKLKQPQHSRHYLAHPILHHHRPHNHDKKSQSENIPSSTNKIEQHVVNNDHCDSCGELYGEMISCDKCPATFHLLCANPPLSREDVPKGSYFCENCRAKAAEEEEEELQNKDKQIKVNIQIQKPALTNDLKKKINVNGFKKNLPQNSTIGQIKLPTGKDRSRVFR